MQMKLGPVSIFLFLGHQTMASILSLRDDGEVILKSFQSECVDKVNSAVDIGTWFLTIRSGILTQLAGF